jgi:hypothetical protein
MRSGGISEKKRLMESGGTLKGVTMRRRKMMIIKK